MGIQNNIDLIKFAIWPPVYEVELNIFTLYATKIMDVIWELRNQVQHNGSNLNLNELPSKVTKRSHEHRLRILVSLPKILVMQEMWFGKSLQVDTWRFYVDATIQGNKVCVCCYLSKLRRCICEGMDKSGASAQHCNSELSKVIIEVDSKVFVLISWQEDLAIPQGKYFPFLTL